MELKIYNAAIVYLSLSLFLLFIGVKRMPKDDVIFETLLILFVTFVINVLCINGLNKLAWYLIIFFILIPFSFVILAMMPLIIKMISSSSLKV